MSTGPSKLSIYKLAFQGATISLALSACTGGSGSHTTPTPPPVTPVEVPKTVAELETDLETVLKKVSPTGTVQGFQLANSATELSSVPQDPKNVLSAAKIALGQKLFHETALLANPLLTVGKNTVSCASCHAIEFGMAAGIRQSLGEGGWGAGEKRHWHSEEYNANFVDFQMVAAPIALNLAYQKFMLWDGHLGTVSQSGSDPAAYKSFSAQNASSNDNSAGFQGIETQALVGQNTHRIGLANITGNATWKATYLPLFRSAFPGVADANLFTNQNLALALASFVRSLTTTKAPFQRFVRGERASSDTATILKASELRGGILFFGKANCFSCHTGPALNSMRFEAMGYGDLVGSEIVGNNTNDPKHLGRGGYTQNAADNFKFKIPQLYNVKQMPFMGHGGTFTSIGDIVHYYNKGIPQNTRAIGSTSSLLKPLGLSESEMSDLTAFVEDGLLDPDLDRYLPSAIPSGLCSPTNDPESKAQIPGCH